MDWGNFIPSWRVAFCRTAHWIIHQEPRNCAQDIWGVEMLRSQSCLGAAWNDKFQYRDTPQYDCLAHFCNICCFVYLPCFSIPSWRNILRPGKIILRHKSSKYHKIKLDNQTGGCTIAGLEIHRSSKQGKINRTCMEVIFKYFALRHCLAELWLVQPPDHRWGKERRNPPKLVDQGI